MGGGSTSQSALLRETKQSPSRDFDLRSWQGLTQVLKMGKDSLREPGAYSEFRNLVLEYAQKGGDAEIRKKIDAIIATFKESAPASEIAPEKELKSEEAKTEEKTGKTSFGVIGTRRAPPRFISKTPSISSEPPAQAPQPTPSVPQSVEEKAPELAPEPTPVPSAPPAPEPAPVVEVPPPPQKPVVPEFKTLDEHKARIAEIKRLVNARVGNPATLIDTHNELGKKYMTALLSALKATGGGGEGVDAAMVALEGAYQALIEHEEVKNADAKKESAVRAEEDAARWEEKEETVPPPSVPEAPTPAPVEPEVKEEPAEVPVPEMPREEVREVEVPPVTTPVVEEIPEPAPLPSRDSSEVVRERVDEKIQSVMATLERDKPRIGIGSLFKSGSLEETTSDIRPQAGNTEGTWPANRHVLKGIGKQSPEEVKAETGIDTAQITAKQTELSSPEITAMLHQLLSEWNIFHGSGFFGMGPSGPEHPLYKTLAPLSMGEVIAGRWEGSNHKLTKTIKQYVDAWRHEQGIAYVINETFEHYLRRVIQRIMKRQQGKTDS